MDSDWIDNKAKLKKQILKMHKLISELHDMLLKADKEFTSVPGMISYLLEDDKKETSDKIKDNFKQADRNLVILLASLKLKLEEVDKIRPKDIKELD